MAHICRVDVASLPPQQQPQGSGCVLYVIQEVGNKYFKIGVAGHPARRLSALQCGNRRKLEIIAAYRGTRAHCLEIERLALRYLQAEQNSEWVYAEELEAIIRFLSAFEVPE